MERFINHERRISANASLTKFRVQYKEGKKPKAKIFEDLNEARRFRDKSDTPKTKALLEIKETAPIKDVVQEPQKDSSAILAKKLQLLEKQYQIIDRHLQVIEKIIGM